MVADARSIPEEERIRVARSVVEALRAPAALLDRRGVVLVVNERAAALLEAGTTAPRIGRRLVEAFGPSSDDPRPLRAVERLLRGEGAFDAIALPSNRADADPDPAIVMSGRPADDPPGGFLITFEDRREVVRRTFALRLLGEITRAATEARSARAAIESTLRLVCERNSWQVGHAWRRSDDGGGYVSMGLWYASGTPEVDLSRIRDESEDLRVEHGSGRIGRVAEGGEPVHVDDLTGFDDRTRRLVERLGVRASMACPVTVDGEVVAVLEFFHVRPIEREPVLLDVMHDVGVQIAHAIERDRLERLIAGRADRERRTLARRLHDGLGQELTAIGMLATRVANGLDREESSLAEAAARLVETAEAAKRRVRALSKGLMPLSVEPDGLVGALRDLVDVAAPAYPDVEFRMRCAPGVRVEDAFVATHLHRIAQEALSNALKHAGASVVSVRLERRAGEVELEVRDDGAGMSRASPRGRGSGLEILRHRAALLGAALTIESGPDRGTTIRCRVDDRARAGGEGIPG